MNIDELKTLAGISNQFKGLTPVNTGSNVSVTGTEKAQLMRKHHIEPGTPEWFKLWFSKPYLTGERPI